MATREWVKPRCPVTDETVRDTGQNLRPKELLGLSRSGVKLAKAATPKQLTKIGTVQPDPKALSTARYKPIVDLLSYNLEQAHYDVVAPHHDFLCPLIYPLRIVHPGATQTEISAQDILWDTR